MSSFDRDQIHQRELARVDGLLALAREEINRLTECLAVADADRVPLAMDVEILRARLATIEKRIARTIEWANQEIKTGDGVRVEMLKLVVSVLERIKEDDHG